VVICAFGSSRSSSLDTAQLAVSANVAMIAISQIAPEHLISLKVLASRPKDLEDVRGMLRIAEVDHARVERTLAELEAMLDQSDLRPVYARLRAEPTSRKAGAKAGGVRRVVRQPQDGAVVDPARCATSSA
jgi:hypothetical protein